MVLEPANTELLRMKRNPEDKICCDFTLDIVFIHSVIRAHLLGIYSVLSTVGRWRAEQTLHRTRGSHTKILAREPKATEKQM